LFESESFLVPADIRKELELLKKQVFEKVDSPIVFCHNDLLAANIIYQPRKAIDLSQIDDGDEVAGSVESMNEKVTSRKLQYFVFCNYYY
jgi:thiamine kinase-like enzyme